MQVVIGLFEEKSNLETAVAELKQAGISADKLTLLTRTMADDIHELISNDPEESTIEGALAGTAVGSLLGLVSGLGLLTIAGVGPVLAAGAFSATSGGIFGGFLGSLFGARSASHDEYNLEEGLANGGTLLIAEVVAAQEETAVAALEAADGKMVSTYEVDPGKLSDLSD